MTFAFTISKMKGQLLQIKNTFLVFVKTFGIRQNSGVNFFGREKYLKLFTFQTSMLIVKQPYSVVQLHIG